MAKPLGMWLLPVVVYPAVYPMAFIGALVCEAYYRKSSFRSRGDKEQTADNKITMEQFSASTVSMESELDEMRQERMIDIENDIAAKKESMENQLAETIASREREINVDLENKRKLELEKLETEISEKKAQAERDLEEAASQREMVNQEAGSNLGDREALLDDEMEQIRARRLEILEKELSEYKEKELEKISEWSEREMDRLRSRLELEYKMQFTKLQTELTEKVQQEFEAIHRFFESVKEEKKAVAEGEIMAFLEQKERDIVKLIKEETPLE